MTSSSSSSGRSVSWLHLCIIYGLLCIYGLWAATSYQLMRNSLLDELELELSQRRSPVAGDDVELVRVDRRRLVDVQESAAVRRRRSADDPPSQGGDLLTDVKDPPVLTRNIRDTTDRRRPGRRRRNRNRQRRTQTGDDDSTRRRIPNRHDRQHQRQYIECDTTGLSCKLCST